ncbi:MAG: NADH-quinone oxidoreductase subunit C [Bacillota bacterium]
MLNNEQTVAVDELLVRAEEMKEQGYRFIAVTCVRAPHGFDLIYHFDRDLSISHLRVAVINDTPVHSLSSLYPGAYFVENEVHDLYGVHFVGLSVDYEGRFILAEDAPATPMVTYQGKEGK